MTVPLERATVIGAGAMGTLTALLLASRGIRVTLWGRSPDQVDQLQTDRENKRYLPGHRLPDLVTVTADAAPALADPELIVSAVPCQHIRSVWWKLVECGAIRAPIVSVAKGIEVDTLLRPTQILVDAIGEARVAALSGPSIAPEIADGLPATVVVASDDLELATLVQQCLSTRSFRIYTNLDLIGVELGGAVKNVIGIAAGIGDGLEIGANAKAALLTRGLVEITRLGVAIGAHADTFKGLAGIGDLIATCSSPVSRNRTAGEKIGQGLPLNEVVQSSHGVIEGIDSTRSVLELAEQNHVEMPITRAIYSVLFEHRDPRSAIDELMTRQLKAE